MFKWFFDLFAPKPSETVEIIKIATESNKATWKSSTKTETQKTKPKFKTELKSAPKAETKIAENTTYVDRSHLFDYSDSHKSSSSSSCGGYSSGSDSSSSSCSSSSSSGGD